MELSETDYAVLQQIAKAKNLTPEEVLREMGHLPATPTIRPADAPPVAPPDPPPADTPIPDFDIEEDAPPSDVAGEPELPPLAEPESEAATEGPTLGTALSFCPHCGLNPAKPPMIEPSRQDKLFFLHCLLGDQLFSKSFSCFNGVVTFTFRSLRSAELDILYQETFLARQRGVVITAEDAATYMLGLRLYAQLCSVRVSGGSSIQLPGGLTKASSPDAAETWDMRHPIQSGTMPLLVADPTKTLFTQIQDDVCAKVLKRDTLVRAARIFNDRFCSLVAHLELHMMDDPFWNEIETPP